MERDLEELENKVGQLVRAMGQLREENRALRQQLAMKAEENRRLAEKIEHARGRVSALLERLPSEVPTQ